MLQASARWLRDRGIAEVVCASARERSNLGAIISRAVAVASKPKGRKRFKAELTEVRVVGLPNAGKSSLINALRGNAHKGKGGNAPVGGNPGTTRHVRGFTLQTAAKGGGDLIMIDTPGVMAPKIDDSLVGLRLALSGCVREGAVEYELLADYLLFRLNQMGSSRYVDVLGLPAPTDNVTEVLARMMEKRGFKDEEKAAEGMVRAFRAGKLGGLVIDDLSDLAHTSGGS